jgi:hypothetical protein
MKIKLTIFSIIAVIVLIFAITYLHSGNQSDQSNKFTYSIGTKVDFGKNGASGHFIVKGWSGQESWHRWTDGSEAVLRFKADAFKDQDILITANGMGFLPGMGKTQRVDVEVNGILVATWNFSSSKQLLKAKIPKKVSNSGILNLTFVIERPTSPLELGLSKDPRKLGLALQNITLSKEL